MDIGDDALVFRAKEGDKAAFEALLSRHYERLHGFCWRLVGPPPECEDLCQDLCIRIATSIAQFDGRSQFATWAYAIALNLARDEARKQVRRAKLRALYVEAEEAAAADHADDEAKAAWLRAAMWKLQPAFREALVLVLEEGFSHKQAADLLGVREGTISWRLNQARAALKIMAQEPLDL